MGNISQLLVISQRMDLGECPKYHDVALRADFETASKKKDYFYDIDVSCVSSMHLYPLVWPEIQHGFYVCSEHSKYSLKLFIEAKNRMKGQCMS